METGVYKIKKFLLITIFDLCIGDRLFCEDYFSDFWTNHVRNIRDSQDRILWRKWSLISTLLMELYSYCSRFSVSQLHVGNGRLSFISGISPLTIIVSLDEQDITINSCYEKIDITNDINYGNKRIRDSFKLDIKVETINLEDLNGFFTRCPESDNWLILNLKSSLDNIPKSSEDILSMFKFLSYQQQWVYLDMSGFLNKQDIFSNHKTDIASKHKCSVIRTTHDKFLDDQKSLDFHYGFITNTNVFKSFLGLFNSKF